MQDLIEQDPQAAEHFGPIVASAPEPAPQWDWIWRAWWTLNAGDRPHQVMGAAGMGGVMIRSVPGPLPWSVIQRWIEVNRMSETRGDVLRYVLAKMDETYLAWWREAANAE